MCLNCNCNSNYIHILSCLILAVHYQVLYTIDSQPKRNFTKLNTILHSFNCTLFICYSICLFFDYKRINMNISTKSNFLQKKRQQRKKTQDKIQSQSKVSFLQKNIRAFLGRRKILHESYQQNDVERVILMGSDISKFPYQIVDSFVQKIRKQPPARRYRLFKKIILSCIKSQNSRLFDLALKLASQNTNQISSIFETKDFVLSLIKLLKKRLGYPFLNPGWENIRKSRFVNNIPEELLFDIILHSFRGSKMQAEGIQNNNINIKTTLSIVDYLSKRNYIKLLTVEQFVLLSNAFSNCLKLCNLQSDVVYLDGLTYIVELLKNSLKKRFEQTIQEVIQKEKLKSLIGLIEDEQQLQYFQNRTRAEPQFEQFCQITLEAIQNIFHYPQVLHLLIIRSNKFRQILTSFISQIRFIYDDRKILFVYHFLSDQTSIKEMSKQKKQEFYSALNMKMMTMDDQDFANFNLFDDKEWRQIIQVGIAKAFEITKKMLVIGAKKQKIDIKTKLFNKEDELETELKTLSDLLNNLNKKCLRTSKIQNQFFINEDLDKFLNTFKFGVGARAIQLMLKHFPFTFRFQSRIKKLREFIKADKLNHDRSLFLQEEVDPDLVIAVRRGHQFLDAYDACAYKDLRKKYKIVFFNEQGLEEEGIDGGGIIKEFINRVLKSSFSSIYGMFYETQQNEILPNHESPMMRQYEFVGKIVGKAVYQNINIDQKFAEPFLNLLIGRKNTFEDLQFIDKQVYKSMIDIRKMNSKDLEAILQTFTILDISPSGKKNVVNLRNLSLGQKAPETIVNSQNKVQFVMSYADFKCNKQLEQKTRLFRRGFLTVMKSEWLTMFSNEELNLIISGSNPNYSVLQLKNSVLYKDYNEKSQTIVDLWAVLSEFTAEQKSAFLLYVTSCSRPPTMGFASMKPLICIQKSNEITHLPTANTCMNVFRLPDYKNRQVLKQKLLYAINSKAGFQFA